MMCHLKRATIKRVDSETLVNIVEELSKHDRYTIGSIIPNDFAEFNLPTNEIHDFTGLCCVCLQSDNDTDKIVATGLFKLTNSRL